MNHADKLHGDRWNEITSSAGSTQKQGRTYKAALGISTYVPSKVADAEPENNSEGCCQECRALNNVEWRARWEVPLCASCAITRFENEQSV